MALSKDLLKFKERAWAHEVVVSAIEVNSVEELLTIHWDIDENTSGFFIREKIPEEKSPILLIKFYFNDNFYEVATAKGLDVIFLSKRIDIGEDNQESFFKFQGTMSIKGFWEYLGSMPNKYKYLIEDSTGRSEYWKKQIII